MFVFDKQLSPEQAINHKPSSKAPFGFMTAFTLGVGGTNVLNIACKDPSVAAAAPAAGGAGGATEAAVTANAVALLTRLRWELGATDPIIIEGLAPISLKQVIAGQLYATLTDIQVNFAFKVFEYDPVSAAKGYYACCQSPTPLVGKILKEGDRELAIELNDNDELSIQDNSFYAFSIKVVPFGLGQTIELAAKTGLIITKLWGRTNAL